jgi:hypothetical protein
VAHHKYVSARRHAEVERRHLHPLAERQERDTQGRQERAAAEAAAREEVSRLLEHATPEERLVIVGHLNGRSQAQIADDVARNVPGRNGKCSQTTVSNIWRRLCERWREQAAAAEEGP